MRKIAHLFGVILLVLSISCFTSVPTHAIAVDPSVTNDLNDILQTEDNTPVIDESQFPFINANAALMVNADTGQILYYDTIDKPMNVYSVSKLMSAYIVLQKIAENNPNFTWDTKIKIDADLSLISTTSGFSNVPLEAGESYTVKDLFDASLIVSANAALMALARSISGDEASFVKLMNETAANIGLTQSKFTTSTGLSGSDISPFGIEVGDGDNTMTARDVGLLSMHLINEYPEVIDVTKQSQFTFGAYTDYPEDLVSANHMLPGLPDEYPGMEGLKTGSDIYEYTSSFAGYTENNGLNIITVIIGCRNADDRNVETAKMLDFAYKTLDKYVVVAPDSSINGIGGFETRQASKSVVSAAVKEKFVLLTTNTKFSVQAEFIPTHPQYNDTYNKFQGNILAGEKLGNIAVKGVNLLYLKDGSETYAYVPVYATEDVGEGFFLFNWIEELKDIIVGVFV